MSAVELCMVILGLASLGMIILYFIQESRLKKLAFEYNIRWYDMGEYTWIEEEIVELFTLEELDKVYGIEVYYDINTGMPILGTKFSASVGSKILKLANK